MQRYARLIVSALMTFTAGAATGYFWSSHQAHTKVVSALEAGELATGNTNLAIMQWTADGSTEKLYLLAEAKVISTFTLAHYALDTGDKIGQLYGAFYSNVMDFYRRYPERRAALRTRYSHDPQLLTWIDGGR